MPRPGLAGQRRRLDGDDRHRRGTGRPGHHRAAAAVAAQVRARRKPLKRVIDAVRAVPRRHQPDVLPGAGRVDDPAAVRDACCCASPTTSAGHEPGSTRCTSPPRPSPPSDTATSASCNQPTWLRICWHRVDVRRGDHHGDPGGVRRRRAAVAPPRAIARAAQGARICATTSSSSGSARSAIRVVSDLKAAGYDVAVIERRRRQPLPVDGRPNSTCR